MHQDIQLFSLLLRGGKKSQELTSKSCNDSTTTEGDCYMAVGNASELYVSREELSVHFFRKPTALLTKRISKFDLGNRSQIITKPRGHQKRKRTTIPHVSILFLSSIYIVST